MLTIVWDTAEVEQVRDEGRDCYTPYLLTILSDLGLSCRVLNHKAWLQSPPNGVTLVAGGTDDSQWAAACRSYCERGNALLAIGGVYGLEDVLGVVCTGRVREGWVDWASGGLADGMRSAFHFFEAICVESRDAGVKADGSLVRLNGSLGVEPTITVRDHGQGAAALLAVDLMKTFCLIQQGVAVVRDGRPAPDGTAATDDDVLKTDDAAVLDWTRDRTAAEAGGVPIFLHPVVDEWRIVLMRLIYRLHEKIGAPMAQSWFWPDGLTAIGHISHDTDGNSPAHACALLARLKEANIRSTWCIIMPGYDPSINEAITAGGHEVALHYNAMEVEIPESRWSERDFRHQLSMLQAQFPDRAIRTNKNHYLRWEGDTAFYRWCERAGVKVEQSRGGTRQGNKGFLAGTCHPFVPVGTAAERNRPLAVLSLPTLAWDPPMPLRCTRSEAFALLDRAVDVNGVAHFLFHPAMLLREGDEVGAFLVELAGYGASRGLAWWTAEQLWQWRSNRAQVVVRVERDESGEPLWVIEADADLDGFTLLIAGQEQGQWLARTRGGAVSDQVDRMIRSQAVNRFGCAYMELTVDIRKGRTEFVCIG
ncbi:hypothetical protein [Paenibacillus eucommiae]|uniref:NodB homology domain-containing protein n=1 Tax=Paenibacillus eucommiae TaxID=1355755 RepID=A0ABS4J525_9BACL|nr:hypothetical protein [Paenibacillus eucommiae]MBP1994937.1 hypothetical protein [Paenibacillus eucommiae]